MSRKGGGAAASSSSSSSADGGKKFVGCIGKCTSGIGLAELDRITDHVQHALESQKGRQIFRRYLEQARRSSDLGCLDLYERCCEYLSNDAKNRMIEENPSVEPLASDVSLALSAAEDLDDVPDIDLALLERYTEALDSQSREAMLDVLEETKVRMVNSLAQAHKGFRVYARQPCPKTKG